MNELLFTNEELGIKVRTILNDDGSICMNAEDVARGFGWTQTQNKNGKQYTSIRWETLNGYAKEYGFPIMLGKKDFIPESLFYRLGMKANNETAQKFQGWLADEVIPQIRKTGGYIPVKESESEEEIMAKALLIAQNTINKKNEIIENQKKQIEQDKPKVIFANAVSASDTSILIGDLAKLLKQNGVDTGAKRLFEWLREKGYLIKRQGADYNSPTQKAMELGLFEVKETCITHGDGHTSVNKTTKVTGKGQQYFINKFLCNK